MLRYLKQAEARVAEFEKRVKINQDALPPFKGGLSEVSQRRLYLTDSETQPGRDISI